MLAWRAMRIARVAVVGAALAVALTGIIGLMIVRAARPSQPVTHYQVALEVPAKDAALWFVARYPKYFTSGEQGLEAWLGTLHERDREFVVAMGQTLAWAWIEHELAGFHDRDLEGLARESTVAVRRKTLNQLELDIESLAETEGVDLLAYIGDPMFSAGIFARLVRGASNCEGQNHLIAVLLESALDSNEGWMPAPKVDMAGLSIHHDIAIVTGPTLAQPVYVDGWGNLPAFTVDPSLPHAAPLLGDLGDPPAEVLPGFAGRSPAAAEVYAEASVAHVEVLPPRNAPTKAVDLEVRAPVLDAAYLAKVKSPWQLYLFARVLHLYDDPRAAELYQLVLDRHCRDPRSRHRIYVCVASALFLAADHRGKIVIN